MKIKVMKEVEIEPAFIRVELAVRYDEEDIPNDFPLRKGDMWNATITAAGKIIEWPTGQTGELAMKVCDEGSYYLLDADKKELAKKEQEYVPCCIPGSYGDYVDFTIDANGVIANWSKFWTERNINEAFFAGD